MRPYRGLAAILIAAALLLPGSASGDAHNFYIAKGTRCVAFNSQYGYQIRAVTTFLMGTHAHKGNNLSSMQMKARLVPTTPGTNLPRNWRMVRTPENRMNPDGYNNWRLTVGTESVSPEYDWDLQVKMRWNRVHRFDWHEKLTAHFNEGFCQLPGGAS